MNQYQVIELLRDINAELKMGMKGVILEVFDADNYEVEFVKEDGNNIDVNGVCTFTLNRSDIKEI